MHDRSRTEQIHFSKLANIDYQDSEQNERLASWKPQVLSTFGVSDAVVGGLNSSHIDNENGGACSVVIQLEETDVVPNSTQD